jgi:hypothetical protein
LRSWLGLAPGPWPPDHYDLLGLSPGPAEADVVERLVLERLATLRTHQLLHPELVTEGMNRLAQALVCLTDPAAQAAYDAERGFAPAVSEIERPVPPPLPAFPYEVIPGFPIPIDDESEPGDITRVIEVPVQTAVEATQEAAPAFEVVDDASTAPPAYEVVADVVIDATFIAPPQALWQPKSKRHLYARMAYIRRLSAGWKKLEPVLGGAREALDRPVGVLIFLESVAELQPLLNPNSPVIGEPWRPGGMVVAVLRQPLPMHAVRSLLPDQRRAVAIDWRNGDSELSREYNRLRELSRSGRRRYRRFRRRGPLMRGIRWAFRNPESMLIVLALAVIAAAVVRSSPGQ